jgi:hypothetical protein
MKITASVVLLFATLLTAAPTSDVASLSRRTPEYVLSPCFWGFKLIIHSNITNKPIYEEGAVKLKVIGDESVFDKRSGPITGKPIYEEGAVKLKIIGDESAVAKRSGPITGKPVYEEGAVKLKIIGDEAAEN